MWVAISIIIEVIEAVDFSLENTWRLT